MDECEFRDAEEWEQKLRWVHKLSKTWGTKLCSWVSSFHPEQLECHMTSTTERKRTIQSQGAYNTVSKIRFDKTGETWAVRFPVLGKASADEKVEAEVAAIEHIRKHTDIPVPEIKKWGLSHENELGLGAFIISVWVDGISLGDALRDDPHTISRLITKKNDLSTLRHVWRQIARFMLQLSRINFDHIGSCTATSRRPLTQRAANILQNGGVENPCPLGKTFTSSLDYFTYVADHDMLHLKEQRNSVDDSNDAREKYINGTIIRQLVPRFVHSDHGPFKLICDDFSPDNMIVDNAEDLNIVAVIDWEFSYAGPQELFWSPPIWLLGKPPTKWERCSENYDDLESQYHKHLDVFIEVMQEEEERFLSSSSDRNHAKDLPSVLLRRKEQDGSMWFYHIMHDGFHGPDNLPHIRLRESVKDFDELAAAIPREEIEAFVMMKMKHVECYEKELAEYRRRHPRTRLRMSMEPADMERLDEIYPIHERVSVEIQNPFIIYPWMPAYFDQSYPHIHTFVTQLTDSEASPIQEKTISKETCVVKIDAEKIEKMDPKKAGPETRPDGLAMDETLSEVTVSDKPGSDKSDCFAGELVGPSLIAKPEHVDQAPPITQSESVVEASLMTQPEPVAESSPIVEPHSVALVSPIAEPELVAKASPIADPQAVDMASPVLELEPVDETSVVAEPEPVVEAFVVAEHVSVVEPEPLIEASLVAKPEPVVEPEPLIEASLVAKPEPVVEHSPIAGDLLSPLRLRSLVERMEGLEAKVEELLARDIRREAEMAQLRARLG